MMEDKYLLLPAHQATDKNGGVKRIVAVGSRRVLDILFESIMEAPENSLLYRVHAHDPLLIKVDEMVKSKNSRKLKESGSMVFGRRKTNQDVESSIAMRMSTEGPNEPSSPSKDEEGQRVMDFMEKNIALKKFLENKVDLSKFEVKVPPLLMKGIIFEVYKFYSKREGLGAEHALKTLQGSTSFRPELLMDKYLAEESQS